MKIQEFRKQLKDLQVSSMQINKYVKELKAKGHCYITINDSQYLCIANN